MGLYGWMGWKDRVCDWEWEWEWWEGRVEGGWRGCGNVKSGALKPGLGGAGARGVKPLCYKRGRMSPKKSKGSIVSYIESREEERKSGSHWGVVWGIVGRREERGRAGVGGFAGGVEGRARA